MKSHLYRSKDLAEKQSKKLGCEGSHRVRKNAWKPCGNKSDLEKVINKPQGEIDELIDYDGTMVSSAIPILDPQVSPSKTMDQTVAATRQTQDPLTRGYRTYVGEETTKEIDMSKAFGWDETWKKLDFDDTVETLYKKLGLDKNDAEDRAEEFGLQDDKEELILKEKKFSMEEINKMVEDLIIKKSEDDDSEMSDGIESIIKRNIRSLKNLAQSEGLSQDELINMIKDE
jgi:hypothetical protein